MQKSTSNEYSHRQATVNLTVLKPDGTPLAGQEVTISQKKHQFLFGCNAFKLVPFANGLLSGEQKAETEQYSSKFCDLFNYATLPFYWGGFEPQPGRTNTVQIKRAAQWCVDHQLLVKGHPLSWHTMAPDWLLNMSNAEIKEAQIRRINRDVAEFKGLIDIWDVINEVVIMPIFDKYDNGLTRLCKELGRIKTIKTVFEAARATNPGATLLLNDFDVSTAYDILIEGCLEAGIKIDIIGIQSHMHQGYWGVEKTLRILERFERFGLPIHFTESTILSGHLMPPEFEDLNDYQVTEWPTTPEGETRQVDEVLLHYKTLMSRPLVTGITWWDFSDGQWLNAPCGLIRQDGTTKPVYDELLKLVKGEWWLAPVRFTSNQDGQISVSGFLGDYELNYQGRQFEFTISKEDGSDIQIQM